MAWQTAYWFIMSEVLGLILIGTKIFMLIFPLGKSWQPFESILAPKNIFLEIRHLEQALKL